MEYKGAMIKKFISSKCNLIIWNGIFVNLDGSDKNL